MLENTIQIATEEMEDRPYKASDLTYANSFPSAYKRAIIRTIENLTGRIKLLRLIRLWERNDQDNPDFWDSVLTRMGVQVTTPQEQYDRIPKDGPLVIIANHPHGLVDGMVMARLISNVRDDYKILTRSLLCTVPRIAKYLLPVCFPHEPNAIQNNIQTRKISIQHLKDGGCIALFPAGTVATSDSYFGEVIEPDWLPFTAKMIRQSGAQVLPVFFPGQNSRLFQIANKLSTTLRQSFLLHEFAYALNKNQAPRVGQIIDAEKIKSFEKDVPALMAFLKSETLKLKTAA